MTLPPGFRFHPTDLELVGYYLRRRVNNVRIEFDVIADVDLYKCEPWDLPQQSLLPSNDLEWFFFSPRDRKYPNGSRTNRATEAGYWKATGRDRTVKAASKASKTLGMKKTLVFYKGRAPHGERTDWLMHEYRLEGDDTETMQMSQDAYVLCRVFKKYGFEPRTPEDNPQDEMNDNADSPPANHDVFQEHDVKPTLHLPAQPLVAQPLSVPTYMPPVKPQMDHPEENMYASGCSPMSKFVLDDNSFNQMNMTDSDIFSICPSSLDPTGTEPESLPPLQVFESPDITKKTFTWNWQQQPQVNLPWNQASRLNESYLFPTIEGGLYGDIDQQLPFLEASPPSAGSPESSLADGEGVAETPSQFVQIRPRLPPSKRSSHKGLQVSGLPAAGNWSTLNRCLLSTTPISVVKNVSPVDETSEEEAAVSDACSKTSESVSLPKQEEDDDAQSRCKPEKEEAEQLNAVAGDLESSFPSTQPATVKSECVGEVDLPPSKGVIAVPSPCRPMSSDEPSEGVSSVCALSHVSNPDETSVMSPAICEAVQESNIHPGNENGSSSGTEVLERAYEASATETPSTEEARNESKVSGVPYGCPVAVEGTSFQLVGSDYSSADAKQSKLGTGGIGRIHLKAVTIACSCDKFASQPHKQAVSCKCYSRSRKSCSSRGVPGSMEKTQEKGAESPGDVDVTHKLKVSKKAFVGVFFLGAISTCVGFFAWQSIFSVVRQFVGSSVDIISGASDL